MTLSGLIGIGIGLLITIVTFVIWMSIEHIINRIISEDFNIAMGGFIVSLIIIILTVIISNM